MHAMSLLILGQDADVVIATPGRLQQLQDAAALSLADVKCVFGALFALVVI